MPSATGPALRAPTRTSSRSRRTTSDFFPLRLKGILNRYLQTPENVCLLAIRGRSKVVGFGIGVPAHSKPDIARDLRGLLPVNHTYYLAELGVLESARGQGLGKLLVATRLELIEHKVFTHVVLRVSAVKNQSYDMYMDMGFDDIGVYTEVHSRRTDGRVSTDRRLFLVAATESSGQPQSHG